MPNFSLIVNQVNNFNNPYLKIWSYKGKSNRFFNSLISKTFVKLLVPYNDVWVKEIKLNWRENWFREKNGVISFYVLLEGQPFMRKNLALEREVLSSFGIFAAIANMA